MARFTDGCLVNTSENVTLARSAALITALLP